VFFIGIPPSFLGGAPSLLHPPLGGIFSPKKTSPVIPLYGGPPLRGGFLNKTPGASFLCLFKFKPPQGWRGKNF